MNSKVQVIKMKDRPTVNMYECQFKEENGKIYLFVDLSTKYHTITHGGFHSTELSYSSIVIGDEDGFDQWEIRIKGDRHNIYESHCKNQLFFFITTSDEFAENFSEMEDVEIIRREDA